MSLSHSDLLLSFSFFEVASSLLSKVHSGDALIIEEAKI